MADDDETFEVNLDHLAQAFEAVEEDINVVMWEAEVDE